MRPELAEYVRPELTSQSTAIFSAAAGAGEAPRTAAINVTPSVGSNDVMTRSALLCARLDPGRRGNTGQVTQAVSGVEEPEVQRVQQVPERRDHALLQAVGERRQDRLDVVERLEPSAPALLEGVHAVPRIVDVFSRRATAEVEVTDAEPLRVADGAPAHGRRSRAKADRTRRGRRRSPPAAPPRLLARPCESSARRRPSRAADR